MTITLDNISWTTSKSSVNLRNQIASMAYVTVIYFASVVGKIIVDCNIDLQLIGLLASANIYSVVDWSLSKSPAKSLYVTHQLTKLLILLKFQTIHGTLNYRRINFTSCKSHFLVLCMYLLTMLMAFEMSYLVHIITYTKLPKKLAYGPWAIYCDSSLCMEITSNLT